MITKFQIRKEIKEKLNRLTQAQRLRKSRLIKKRLFNLTEFKRAKYVMFYVATDKEVQTNFMITAAQKIGKKILVPVILGREIVASLIEDFEKELTLGPYRIRQPQKKYIREFSSKKIDLVVVPGLAFDKAGRRLGRGGGYYDRFLAKLPSQIPYIGLAFDFQILKNLPTLSHDIQVTKVISA
jgi:5-formyltetrahydrofolate cyclo-ligase